jgi:hypothetical protein
MNALLKPLSWEQDGHDWIARTVAGIIRIRKDDSDHFGWVLTKFDGGTHSWDLDNLKEEAADDYADTIRPFIQEPAPEQHTYTLLLNRESAWDDRRRDYYQNETELFVTRSFDEAVAKALAVEIDNLEGKRFNSMYLTLMIDGLTEDDLWDVHDDEDALDEAKVPFADFNRSVALKVQEYKDGAAERKRKADALARQKADDALVARAQQDEARERRLLEELRSKYPDA